MEKKKSSEPVDDGFEDIVAKNRAQIRQFVPTGTLKPTQLNNKRIQIRVTEG